MSCYLKILQTYTKKLQLALNDSPFTFLYTIKELKLQLQNYETIN